MSANQTLTLVLLTECLLAKNLEIAFPTFSALVLCADIRMACRSPRARTYQVKSLPVH